MSENPYGRHSTPLAIQHHAWQEGHDSRDAEVELLQLNVEGNIQAAIAEIETLKAELARCDAQWQSSESRIVHLCQIAGIDYTCEEPERLEQWAERMKGELAELTDKCRDAEHERSTALTSAAMLAGRVTLLTADQDAALKAELARLVTERDNLRIDCSDLADSLTKSDDELAEVRKELFWVRKERDLLKSRMTYAAQMAELRYLAQALVRATRLSLQGEASVGFAEEAADEVEEWLEEHSGH